MFKYDASYKTINISSENDASGVCRINKSSDIEQSIYQQVGRATLGFQWGQHGYKHVHSSIVNADFS